MKKKSITYADLSKKQLQHLKEFYIQRKAYIAAVSRVDYIISSLPESPVTKEALEIKVRAYDLMGKEDLKNQAAEVLRKFIENSKKS